MEIGREPGGDADRPRLVLDEAHHPTQQGVPRMLERAREAAGILFPARPDGAPGWYLERKAAESGNLARTCRSGPS